MGLSICGGDGSLGVRCSKRGKTLVCFVDGEFDLERANDFKSEVQSWFERYESLSNLAIDMRRVGFIDSSGLGAILGRYKQITEMGGKVAVVGLSPNVRRVFELSGVLKLVREAASLDEAL